MEPEFWLLMSSFAFQIVFLVLISEGIIRDNWKLINSSFAAAGVAGLLPVLGFIILLMRHYCMI